MADTKYCATTDRDSVLLLLTAGLPILKTEIDEHNKTKFFFDYEQGNPILDKYRKNQSLMYEASDFLRALRLFNGIVHSK